MESFLIYELDMNNLSIFTLITLKANCEKQIRNVSHKKRIPVEINIFVENIFNINFFENENIFLHGFRKVYSE